MLVIGLLNELVKRWDIRIQKVAIVRQRIEAPTERFHSAHIPSSQMSVTIRAIMTDISPFARKERYKATPTYTSENKIQRFSFCEEPVGIFIN